MLKYIFAFLISLGSVLVMMPKFIAYMKKLSVKQAISEYSLEDDQKKAGTPIMGGILFILFPSLVSLLFSADHLDGEMCVVMLAFVGYGIIGFLDDYLIAVKHDNAGLKPKYKLIMQFVLAILFFLLYRSQSHLGLTIPLFHTTIPLGLGYFILVLLMFVGSSNAVNLTDGMDGLSSGCSIIALSAFLAVAFVQQKFALALFILSVIGSLLGYLYYNKKPAKVFMGDTGSLALGGLLAAIAMVTKTEIGLIFIGGIFVLDTLSVIIQITSVKLRHKKVFIYTPIHFAFRIKGMKETHVVYMFWAVEFVLALIGLIAVLV